MQRHRIRHVRAYRDGPAAITLAPPRSSSRFHLAPIVSGLGLLGGGLLLWYYRDTALTWAVKLGGAVGYYPDPTSRASAYSAAITAASQATGVSTAIIAGLGDRETLWGLSSDLSQPGPAGTGDGGHGRGLMQIDDRTWSSWISATDWTDPGQNVLKGAQIYAAGYNQLQNAGVDPSILARAAADAYNAGPGTVLAAIQAGADPDSVSTGGNYGADVMGRAAKYVGP